MFFNTLYYLIFLAATSIVMYLITSKYQWLWLLACSIFFYLTILPEYLVLFLILTLLNYYLGLAVEQPGPKQNSKFFFGLGMNIFVLAFFKYFGYFQALNNEIKTISGNDRLLRIILPVGLSFFIFTVISYLIEVKRGTVKAERHIGIFASSLLFFPKIMQGPIEKPGKILTQFRESKIFNYEEVVYGLKQMLWGYFKKIVVADRIALYVNTVYGNYDSHSGISLILATILYSFQIYADFSGYTDIALGSAKVLGFNLTNNFNRPFFAGSIKDFWNRWHISLSVWLRDYLYLPIAVHLAGKVETKRYIGIDAEKWIFLVATILTFTICGLWHGEGLNFILWGLLFGVYLTIANWTFGLNKKLLKGLGICKKSTGYRIYSILLTFGLVTFTWIFFRADNTEMAFKIIERIISFNGPLFLDKTTIVYCFIGITILLYREVRIEFYGSGHLPFMKKGRVTEYFAYASLVIIILLIGVFDGGQFIYFQF